MRKNLLLLLLLVGSSGTYAQVGINTTLSLKPLHVDGKKDNSPTGTLTPEQIKNDVVIDEEGKLGIGTISPNAKLDVKGNSDLQGNVNIGGALTINNMVGDVGSYLISQGEGKSPKWYTPKATQQGDISNVKEYSIMMLDDKGNSTVVNVDELFQKYLKTLTIPSVEFYASSTGTQLLKKSYNKISVFKSEMPISKYVTWNATDNCINILEDGRYLFSMQIGLSIPNSFINNNYGIRNFKDSTKKDIAVPMSLILDSDIIVGFTKRDPINTNDLTGLWVGRGVYRMTKSVAGSSRGFTSYSTLLNLKKGDKIYPIVFLDDAYGDNNVLLQGVQSGSAGDGVLTNLNVTKY